MRIRARRHWHGQQWWIRIWLRLPYWAQQITTRFWHAHFLYYESDESGEWRRIC